MAIADHVQTGFWISVIQSYPKY